jgi:hypothetical protein
MLYTPNNLFTYTDELGTTISAAAVKILNQTIQYIEEGLPFFLLYPGDSIFKKTVAY